MASLEQLLAATRGININLEASNSPLKDIQKAAQSLREKSYVREADILSEVFEKCTGPRNFGGLGLDQQSELNESERGEILFLCEAWLESLNAADRQLQRATPLHSRPRGRRGMTLTEKLFAMHDVQPQGSVRPGQVIRVAVDWIMASELSWGGMRKTYDQLGQPGIFRNDRFWLAADHIVDPRINHRPHVKQAIEESEEAKTTFKMTEYQGLNVRASYRLITVLTAKCAIVYHYAYRVFSRARRAWYACYRVGLSYMLWWRCKRSFHRSRSSRRDNGSSS